MDPIGAIQDILNQIVGFFDSLAPAGMGLVLIPLIVFGIITIVAVTRREPVFRAWGHRP